MKKIPGADFKPAWSPLIQMGAAIKERMAALFSRTSR